MEHFEITTKNDGTWLRFKASSGREASVNVEALADRLGIIGSALRQWCADRQAERRTRPAMSITGATEALTRQKIANEILAMLSPESGPDYGLANERDRTETRATNRIIRNIAERVRNRKE